MIEADVVYVLGSYYGYGRDYHCYGVYTTLEAAKAAAQKVIDRETTQWVFFTEVDDCLYERFRKAKLEHRVYEEGFLQIAKQQLDQDPTEPMNELE